MERQKRRRVVGFKPSSDYCRNCRMRRVKCDAQRPACKRCISTGRQCDYLMNTILASSSSGSIGEQDMATSLQVSQNTPFQHGLTITRPASVSGILSSSTWASIDGLQGYEYFQRCAIAAMEHQGAQYPPWIRYALQLSHEPALFYAMAAVGTAQQRSNETAHTALVRLIDTRSNKTALKLYTTAMSHVQKLTSNASDSSSPVESVLLSCLLFMVFEAVQGNILNAAQHIRLGRRIAEGRSLQADAGPDSPLNAVRVGLSVAGVDTISNSHFSLKHKTGADSIHKAAGVLSMSSYEESPGFASLDEAGIELEHLIEARHQIQLQLLQLAEFSVDRICPEANQVNASSRYCLIHTVSRFVDIEGYKDLPRRLTDLMIGHDSWKQKFDRFLSTDLIASQTSTLMQIWFSVSRFNLLSCRQVREIGTDRFEDDCTHTLDLVDSFLRNRRESWDATYGPATDSKTWHRAGIFEFGILPAIFTIASKCRASHVRWRAVEMLYGAKREEATNDSASLALYARSIIQLEEDRTTQIIARLDPTGGFATGEVPEEARFLDVVVSSDAGMPGSFILVGTRFMHESEGNIELVTCRIGRDDPGGTVSSTGLEPRRSGTMVSSHSVELYNRAELVVTGMR